MWQHLEAHMWEVTIRLLGDILDPVKIAENPVEEYNIK